MPGVLKVMTARDVKGSNSLPVPQIHPRMKARGILEFPVICGKKINRRGEVLALVAADTEEHARAAAKAVKQNLELLPEYMTFPEAVMPNAIQLHASSCPTSTWSSRSTRARRYPTEIFEEADVRRRRAASTPQHEPHLPHGAGRRPGLLSTPTDGMVTIQCKSQAHAWRAAESCLHGLRPSPWTSSASSMNPVGGSFGYAVFANTYAIVATAVQNLSMPCTLTLSYEEHNHITGKRVRFTFTNGRVSPSRKDGRISRPPSTTSALDHGAYGSRTAARSSTT